MGNNRNIISTITYIDGYIRISVVELLRENEHEIFFSSKKETTLHDSTNFLKESFKKIGDEIGGDVENVYVVYQNTMPHIIRYKHKLSIASNEVLKADVDNILQLVEKNNPATNLTIVSTEDISWTTISNGMSKTFSKAPIGVKAKELHVNASIHYLDKNKYAEIHETIENANLKIINLFFDYQISPHGVVENTTLYDGTIFIDVTKEKTGISIIKNSSTIYHEVLETKLSSLLNIMKHQYKISEKNITALMNIHGNLGKTKECIIDMNQDGINLSYSYNNDMNKNIAGYVNEILDEIKKLYKQNNNLRKLPVFINGELNKIINLDEFLSPVISIDKINIYKPMTFILSNKYNEMSIGIKKYRNKNYYCSIYNNNKIDKIDMTKPVKGINSMKSKNKRNKFVNIINKLGGSYGKTTN